MKRITLFAGHDGSGKTNIALNYARAPPPLAVGATVRWLDAIESVFEELAVH